MKFDDLHKFREHLYSNYTKTTADKYYFAVKGVFVGLHWEQLSEIPVDEIECRIITCKTKNDFSAAKRGLLELKKCFPKLKLPDEAFFVETSSHKRNYWKRKFEPLQLDTVKRKINSIPDKKLKLAYRLMLASGARAAETAALKPQDILIDDNSICVNIVNGKGGKNRTVTTLYDKYLHTELECLVKSSEADKPLFYSDSHLENKASERGFECHDLRRAFAQEYRKQCRQTAPDTYTANGQVMEAMGHAKWRTTKVYLRRKINF